MYCRLEHCVATRVSLELHTYQVTSYHKEAIIETLGCKDVRIQIVGGTDAKMTVSLGGWVRQTRIAVYY